MTPGYFISRLQREAPSTDKPSLKGRANALPTRYNARSSMTSNNRTKHTADVEVRPSRIQGMGLFARRAFGAGETILRWNASRLIPREDFALLSPAEQHYSHPFDDQRLVLVQPPERFVNHSCNNNTVVRDFCDVAIRKIAPGEEITSNYSSDGSRSEFICSCGSQNCRGKVN